MYSPVMFAFYQALSLSISAFLAKWMVLTGILTLRMRGSPVQDRNQNKERVKDHVWSHKSLIRNLRRTHRIGHKFTKAREFIGLHPEGPGLGKGGGCEPGRVPLLFDLYLKSTSKRCGSAELEVGPFL